MFLEMYEMGHQCYCLGGALAQDCEVIHYYIAQNFLTTSRSKESGSFYVQKKLYVYLSSDSSKLVFLHFKRIIFGMR